MASLLGRRVLARTGGARIGFAGASPAFHRSRSDATGVFFADQKRTAEENVFFKKEDETLVKNLLANNPQLKYDADELEAQLGPVAKDFFLVCRKHGITNVSLDLVKDVQKVFQMHGWKKA